MTAKEEHGGCIEIAQDRIRTSPMVLHDWRLLSRERKSSRQGYTASWDELWYCTRCRKVEERRK